MMELMKVPQEKEMDMMMMGIEIGVRYTWLAETGIIESWRIVLKTSKERRNGGCGRC